MGTILESCEAVPEWAGLSLTQQASILHQIRHACDLAGGYAENLTALLFAQGTGPSYDELYRAYLRGEAPHPGTHRQSEFTRAMISAASEVIAACPEIHELVGLYRTGLEVNGSPEKYLRDLQQVAGSRFDTLVFFPVDWVRKVASPLVRAVSEKGAAHWRVNVLAVLRQRRAQRKVWTDRGLSRARATELVRQGVEPMPDFSDALGRKAALKIPRDLQPSCTVCGKVAHECKCSANDTCGHFSSVRRKDGACPVCRASKAERSLRNDHVEVEGTGHFRGIPMTRGNGKDTVSFWGKAPAGRGRLPKIPRYVGCEIEVEAFKRRKDFWRRIPALASLVSKWHFSIGEDGSLGDDGREARLSPARGKAAEEQIHEVCHLLSECGANITDRCGLHIHVDAADFREAEQFNALLKAWDVVEPKIFEHMPKRARNTYCKPVRGMRVKVEGHYLERDWGVAGERSGSPTNDRYHALNLCNMHNLNSKRKTIEFRIFEGSLDPAEVTLWAHIVSTLVHYAARCDKRLETPKGIASLLRPEAVTYLGLES